MTNFKNWLLETLRRACRIDVCNYENNYYGDQLCTPTERSEPQR